MKKLMLVLLASGSVSILANAETTLPKQCVRPHPHKPYIQNNIVNVFGETARDLYIKLSGDETWITEKGKEYVIKSQGEINCFRRYRTQADLSCAVYQCEIGVIQ